MAEASPSADSSAAGAAAAFFLASFFSAFLARFSSCPNCHSVNAAAISSSDLPSRIKCNLYCSPVELNIVLTLSESCAPCSNQWIIRSSFNSTATSVLSGSNHPKRSISGPSRLVRESIATMR